MDLKSYKFCGALPGTSPGGLLLVNRHIFLNNVFYLITLAFHELLNGTGIPLWHIRGLLVTYLSLSYPSFGLLCNELQNLVEKKEQESLDEAFHSLEIICDDVVAIGALSKKRRAFRICLLHCCHMSRNLLNFTTPEEGDDSALLIEKSSAFVQECVSKQVPFFLYIPLHTGKWFLNIMQIWFTFCGTANFMLKMGSDVCHSSHF